jgi:lambda repressor-like predicted transcriptional regulator
MVANAIFAPSATKHSTSDSIRCITIAKSLLSKSDKSCKHEREGSSLRGISRTSGLAYNTVVSIVRAASQQAQLVHNAKVQAVQTEEVSADELWSFVAKNKSSVSQVS